MSNIGRKRRLSNTALAARLAMRPRPVQAAGLDPRHYPMSVDPGGGANCYAYAMGVAAIRLQPGYFAGNRGVQATGSTAQRLLLDGLQQLRMRDLRHLEGHEWVVSLHQAGDTRYEDGRDSDNDHLPEYHLLRLDVTGWSHKPGFHAVQRLRRPLRDLLRLTLDDRRYRLVGFYKVNPDLLVTRADSSPLRDREAPPQAGH